MRTSLTKLAIFSAMALAACAALHAPRAVAQSQAARPCTAIDDDAERLACYDRALRSAPAPAPAPAAVANTPARATPPTPAAVDPVAPAPSQTLATENRATRAERQVRESTASAAPAAPAPAAPRAPAASKSTPDIVPIVIVQIRALPGRSATFITDQGDTWIQTDTQRQMPGVPFKAEIKPGSMSSFFLVPEDFGHSFRVRRGQ